MMILFWPIRVSNLAIWCLLLVFVLPLNLYCILQGIIPSLNPHLKAFSLHATILICKYSTPIGWMYITCPWNAYSIWQLSRGCIRSFLSHKHFGLSLLFRHRWSKSERPTSAAAERTCFQKLLLCRERGNRGQSNYVTSVSTPPCMRRWIILLSPHVRQTFGHT